MLFIARYLLPPPAARYSYLFSGGPPPGPLFLFNWLF